MTVSKSILKLFGLTVIAILALAPSGTSASASAADPCILRGGCLSCAGTDEEGNACIIWFCSWDDYGYECEEA